MCGITEKIHNLHKKKRPGRFLASCLALVCMISILFITPAYATGELDVSLIINQELAGCDPSTPVEDQTIAYRLTPKTPGAPMPAGSVSGGYAFTVTGSVEAQVGPITYAETGPFRYEISCAANEDNRYTYDRQIYTVDVYVARDLSEAVTIIYKGDEKAQQLKYKHTYKNGDRPVPSAPSGVVNPPVVKTVAGNPSTASTFTFRLEAQDSANPMPAGSINGVSTIHIVGAGTAVFGTWSYTAEGTYYYKISEVNTHANGYTYASDEYTITDSVKYQDGQLVVTRVTTNSANNQVESMSFINRYSSGGGGGSVTTTKPSETPTPTATPTATPTPAPTTTTPRPNPPVTITPTPTPGGSTKVPGNPGTTTLPGENGSLIVIDENGTPIGEWRNDGGVWLYEEYPQQNDKPEKNTQKGPKTGDESQVLIYILMLSISCMSALVSIVYLLIDKSRNKTIYNRAR